MSTTTLSETHRAELRRITGLADRDLSRIWTALDSADSARQALLDLLPQLVALYGSAAATLAADWYDEVRELEEVPGRFRAIPAVLPDEGRTEALARWAVGPLFTATPDFAAALTLAQGGLQRIIANASRETIAGSAIADPRAAGWQRVGRGGCAFCRMLISRGAVYTEARADFASHDHCNCSAVPAWGGRSRPVKPYTPSTRDTTDADRARARAYLAANPT